MNGLSVTVGKRHIVHDFSLTIYDGEVFSLIGENGAGKSALLSSLAGLVHLHGGTVKAYGLDLIKAARFQTRNFMAFSMQEEVLMEELTPEEHIIYACRMMGIRDI